MVKLSAEEVAARFVAIEAQKRRSLERHRMREAQQLNTIAARLQLTAENKDKKDSDQKKQKEMREREIRAQHIMQVRRNLLFESFTFIYLFLFIYLKEKKQKQEEMNRIRYIEALQKAKVFLIVFYNFF